MHTRIRAIVRTSLSYLAELLGILRCCLSAVPRWRQSGRPGEVEAVGKCSWEDFSIDLTLAYAVNKFLPRARFCPECGVRLMSLSASAGRQTESGMWLKLVSLLRTKETLA